MAKPKVAITLDDEIMDQKRHPGQRIMFQPGGALPNMPVTLVAEIPHICLGLAIHTLPVYTFIVERKGNEKHYLQS